MKFGLFGIMLLLSGHSWASAVGVHGMVLINSQQGLIASHMPLHGSIHSHQLLFTLQLSPQHHAKALALLSEYPLITLKPERFDLHQLMHGSLTEFTTEVVAGHFERGGRTELEQVTVNVTKILLNQPLSEQDNGNYYAIDLGPQTLLAHRIAAIPSFDQLILVDSPISAIGAKNTHNAPTPQLRLGNGQPLSDHSLWQGMPLYSLYLETQDFQAR